MMAPMLEVPSRSDEAPSTLILKTPGGGGGQLQVWIGLGVDKSMVAASLKSSIELFAICQTWEGKSTCPHGWLYFYYTKLPRQQWRTTLFLLYQIAQATVKNNSKSWEGLWARMNMAESWNVILFLWIDCGSLDQKFQIKLANSQWSKAWWVVSSSLLQIGHSLLVLMPQEHILSFVGSPLTQALHAKILIFVRRLRSHRFFQKGLNGSPFELPTSSFTSTKLWAIWYVLFTVNSPRLFPSKLICL